MEKSVILLSTTEFFKTRLELNNVSNNVLEKDDVIDLTQSSQIFSMELELQQPAGLFPEF